VIRREADLCENSLRGAFGKAILAAWFSAARNTNSSSSCIVASCSSSGVNGLPHS
jgi:hypothetical protein